MSQNVSAIPRGFKEGRHFAEGLECSFFRSLQAMVLILWLVIPSEEQPNVQRDSVGLKVGGVARFDVRSGDILSL